MSVFTPPEIAYLQSQRLGRFATVDAKGSPHVVPVGLHYNTELDVIEVGGHGIAKSAKFAHAKAHPLVAIVIDDLASVSPWRPRGIEIRGTAEVLSTGGEAFGRGFDPPIIRIHPRRIVSWGIEAQRRAVTVKR
jgi:pyridoxamine 5'-phosphate oxidase family protein